MRSGIIGGIICTLMAAAVLAPMVIPDIPWPAAARDALADRGFADTGAPNLVAAIYLGYRAYDTLGETVVLLAALSGAIGLIKAAGKTGPDGGAIGSDSASAAGSKIKKSHTNIIDLTAGKLSPIVLLFGWYVMFYGHQSPGGGFQGGVVLASGIVFIALGRREGGIGRLDARHSALGSASMAWVEVAAFLLILVLCSAGLAAGGSFLENPIVSGSGIPPVAYIIAFNLAIGLKVGSGIALVCLLMMGSGND
ncbi:MnhB domain-containing protein [Breznakiella homolactica]|uniref:Na+/H+ antiporter MnhB subunit-related protein domain-containing protein n=1 Tax=Breznakiella homolactica TaxID=2798577 RepID=A0A7T7XR65_9SPIR|nr:MnhB domain-containing protein [Breznakiella homolactica]QQO10996.1 hypothetical protein JFL75_08780 [Breznakiella homolactica]